jgi:Ni,Fe-hydrogenase III large subunit
MTYEPYSHLKIEFPHEHDGDVAARVSLRFKELFESLSAILQIIDNLPNGSIHVKLPKLSDIHTGLGCVEGWRGPVFVALCNQDADHLLWVHMHDPSWQNWPALEYAVMGNIVPDFPLINKSFNLSYSGCDG